MPTELELIALETEFTLLLPFIKRLVLSLPDCNDRVRAAMWLQSLRKVNDDNFKKLRNEHAKLLLFALHRRSLVGVFEKPPPPEIESFHDGLTLLEMTRELIEITEKQKSGGDNEDPTASPLPQVVTNVSADLKEYSAAQLIPKFGAHVYFAVSNEPIQMWRKSPNSVYPAMGDYPNPMQWEQAFAKLDDHVLEQQAAVDKAIAIAKAIEAGDMTEDEIEPAIDFSKKIPVEVCQPIVFKWKKDSILNTFQTYDFSDVGTPEDIIQQGKHQLELDEHAFSIMDDSLPGRQRIVIRDPFYKGLPADLPDRRRHGVVEDTEIEYDSEEPEDTTASTSCGDFCNPQRMGFCEKKCCRQNGDTGSSDNTASSSFNTPPSSYTMKSTLYNTSSRNNANMPGYQPNFNGPCGAIDQHISQRNQFDPSKLPQHLQDTYQMPQNYDYDCGYKQNASTGMTGRPDYMVGNEIDQGYQTECNSSNAVNYQQQYDGQQYGNQPQQTTDWSMMYNNANNFRYEDGCYDNQDEYNVNDFNQPIQNYDYSLNRPPPNESNCCADFFGAPPQTDNVSDGCNSAQLAFEEYTQKYRKY